MSTTTVSKPVKITVRNKKSRKIHGNSTQIPFFSGFFAFFRQERLSKYAFLKKNVHESLFIDMNQPNSIRTKILSVLASAAKISF